MDHRTISQKPEPPNKVFHVKPLALAGLAAFAALSQEVSLLHAVRRPQSL